MPRHFRHPVGLRRDGQATRILETRLENTAHVYLFPTLQRDRIDPGGQAGEASPGAWSRCENHHRSTDRTAENSAAGSAARSRALHTVVGHQWNS